MGLHKNLKNGIFPKAFISEWLSNLFGLSSRYPTAVSGEIAIEMTIK